MIGVINMAKFRCKICGFVFDEEKEGKTFDSLPETWVCPKCFAKKTKFMKLD